MSQSNRPSTPHDAPAASGVSPAGREGPPLPGDLAGCHAMIRGLQWQLAQKTRLIVGLMGYDPTDTAAVFGYAHAMDRASKSLDSLAMQKAIEQELAAEDANRAGRRRKRK